MTLKDWQARWGDHIPAQALAELTDILSPVMPSPAPTTRHSEAVGAAQIRLAAGRAGVPLFRNNSGAMTDQTGRSEEHTSELQSLAKISYAVFCLAKGDGGTNSVCYDPAVLGKLTKAADVIGKGKGIRLTSGATQGDPIRVDFVASARLRGTLMPMRWMGA